MYLSFINCDTAWYDGMKIKRYLAKIDYSFLFQKKTFYSIFFFRYCDQSFFSLFPNLVKMLCQWNHSFFNLIRIFVLTINLCNIAFWFDLAYQFWQSLLWLQLSVKSVSSVWNSACMLYWSITKWTTFRPLILTLHSAANLTNIGGRWYFW